VARVLLDGEQAGFGGEEGVVDFSTKYRTLSRTVSSRPVELTEGDHLLTLRCDGQPQGEKPKTLGIDFIWVQKQ
jgi:hypothetical protein